MFRVKRLFKIPDISFGRLPTPSQISSYIKQCIDASQYDFHETESFEVTGIITDDPLNRGSVTGTFINDPSQPAVILRPVQTAVLTVPVVGEHVIASEYNGQHFYTAILNRKGNVTENSMPGISGTYDPKTTYSADGTFKTKPVRPIQISEGCTLFEGRMGQSIHFDRNKKNNSPNIKLRVNDRDTSEMKSENIDTDDSSIYLISNGVPFQQTTFDGEEIKGKKVLIKSDGIFIKGNDIRLGSGISGNLEPVVKGNELKKLLDVVFEGTISTNEQAIKTNTVEIIVKTNAGDVKGSAELTQTNIELQKQNTKLTDAINNSSYLSDKVKTV
jgi:hypothetical protein